ncbi:MAG: tRNA pseudouridine(38-40) synthase TruA [Candidatus Theseobacter exili]|nr:tRNA pseudouridine(38-40) synthase TruA [Candidatus Theseobacter exili]
MIKSKKRNIKIKLEYDGTEFAGWQVQPEMRTVQGSVETSLNKLTGEKIRVIGAGRTDAGVHAKGQVAHFSTSTRLTENTLLRGINALLPKDVVVLSAEEVTDTFHARFSAVKKTYCYSVWTAKISSPLHRRITFHYPHVLSITEMQKAAAVLVGSHDFASFASNRGKPEASTVREIMRFDIIKADSLLRLIIEADGFLYKMVRRLAGTIIEVGRGKISMEELKDILMKANRKYGGPNLPPHGLCLEKVVY